MANRNSGPTRPPVLEGAAREKASRQADQAASAANATPDTAAPVAETSALKRPDAPGKTTEGTGAKASPSSQKTAAPSPGPAVAADTPPRRAGVGMLVLAALGGAVGGLALSYGLAVAGAWPGSGEGPALSGRLAMLEAEIDRLAATPAPGVAPEVLDGLVARLTALEEAPELVVVDEAARGMAGEAQSLSVDLARQVESLTAQFGAMAGVVEAGGDGDAAALAALGARLEEMTRDLAGMRARLEESDARLVAIETAQAEAPRMEDLTALSLERERLVRWPGAVADLIAGLRSGQGYATALAGVSALAPELVIPEAITQAAATGIAAPGVLAAQFGARVPDMLRAMPGDPEASWTDQLLGQAAAALALRPSGEDGGEGPQADLARAEAALEAGDFAAAQAALARLPAPMLDAAGPVVAEIAARAEADAFIASVQAHVPVATGSEPQE